MGAINCKEYGASEESVRVQKGCGNGSSESYSMPDYVEQVVCNVGDIGDNEMKQLDFGEDAKILLVKQNGQLSAIGNKCTHYGAPLHTGVLGDKRVKCPWHGACFNIETGDIEDFPGLDSLPCYKVQVESDGKVKVRAKKSDLEKNRRLKDMVPRDLADERVFVVVGGGPAGGVCVEALRQEGFGGRIVLICKENALPYDRVKVSKAMSTDLAAIQFRPKEFYEEHGIETLLGVEVTQLNATEKTVKCSNGYVIKYDKIFVATGSRAVKAPIPGADLKNVFTLRDVADGKAVHALLTPETNVVCLGSSFIALEAADYCVKKVKSTTVVLRDEVPFKPSLGVEVGRRVLHLFEEQKVVMKTNSGITECIGKDGQITAVRLKDGSELPCDVLIMGTGSRLYTDFFKGSGVPLNADGSVDADMHLMTHVPDVYVGGDIAHAPVFSLANQRATIGHYQIAQYHGRVAAVNMAGKRVEDLRAVPFFWTMLFGKGVRYSGHGKFAEVRIEGSLENLKFVAYYMDEHGNVISVASVGHDPIVAQFSELQAQGKRLHKNDLEKDAFAWTRQFEKKSLCV